MKSLLTRKYSSCTEDHFCDYRFVNDSYCDRHYINLTQISSTWIDQFREHEYPNYRGQPDRYTSWSNVVTG